MSYTFGKPRPDLPQTIVGEVPKTDIVLSLMTRVKIVVRVPDRFTKGGPGFDLGPEDFEPDLRKVVADALLGIEANGFKGLSVAVEQFEDAGPRS